MLGQTFYHQTIRKYVALFGTLFNDINIEKKDAGGNVLSRQKVPIAYGPKQKFLTRINQDASLDRQVAIQLPRMGFEMTGMAYDPVRKLNTIGTLTHKETINGNRNVKKMFNPSPYIFDFSLYAFVENAEDGTQILEQILPFFTPEFNVTVNIITDMGLSIDIPIVIQSATSEDSYEGEFSARRTIIWTISFMMKGFIYPDIKTGQSIIKKIEVAFKEIAFSSLPEAGFLVNVSNDAWFGDTIGPHQHFVHSVFRSIESGKYLIRSANNGISAIINPVGFIEKKIGFGQTESPLGDNSPPLTSIELSSTMQSGFFLNTTSKFTLKIDF